MLAAGALSPDSLQEPAGLGGADDRAAVNGLGDRRGFSLDPVEGVSRQQPEFDGVAELWWESMEDLAAASSTDLGRAAGRELLEDERKFIDLARSPLWLADEHQLIG